VKALQISAIRTGVDLKLFELLANGEGPISIANLHEASGCDYTLMGQ